MGAIAPFYQQLSQSNDFKEIPFLKVDCDKMKRLAQGQGVQAFPTFMFYANGQKLSQYTIKGGNRNRLQQVIAQLNTKYPTGNSHIFSSGKGHSLNAPSSSSSRSKSSSSSSTT